MLEGFSTARSDKLRLHSELYAMTNFVIVKLYCGA